MTPSEFKAWFDGFTEAFEGRIPTKAQWGRVKDRVAEIDGQPTTQTIYVDRYINRGPYWTYLGHGVCSGSTGISTAGFSSSSTYFPSNSGYATGAATAVTFNSHEAMGELGRAEARSLAA